MAAALIITEGATQLAHNQIQIPALALNRSLGVIVGVITGVFLVVVCVYELGAAANPFGGSSLDPLQQRIRDAYNGSHVIVPLVTSDRQADRPPLRCPRYPPIPRSTSVPAQSTLSGP